MQNLYAENFKTLMNKIKGQNWWGEMLCSEWLDTGSDTVQCQTVIQMLQTPISIVSIAKLNINKKINKMKLSRVQVDLQTNQSQSKHQCGVPVAVNNLIPGIIWKSNGTEMTTVNWKKNTWSIHITVC